MSVNTSPTGMPTYRRPPTFGGDAEDLVMYCVDTCKLPSGLTYRPDPSQDGHGFIEPAREMPVTEYVELLGQTQSLWMEVSP